MTQPTKDDIDRCAVALEHARPDLERIQEVVGGFVHQTCLEISFERRSHDWYRVAGESRVKDAAGIARTLKEKGAEPNQIWEVNDIVGARAVVVTLSDAEFLATALIERNSVVLHEKVCKAIDDRDSGYRALHIKGWLEDGDRRVGCEIQIRTGLQDAFSVVSRSHLYKSGNLPDVLRELGRAQADHLATIDHSFELIKALVHDYHVSPVVRTGESALEVLNDHLQ
jgi:ppGpp synthetase/RelA/SpoT-type nucleotidyltranferase